MIQPAPASDSIKITIEYVKSAKQSAYLLARELDRAEWEGQADSLLPHSIYRTQSLSATGIHLSFTTAISRNLNSMKRNLIKLEIQSDSGPF